MEQSNRRSPLVVVVIVVIIVGLIATYSSLFFGNTNQNTATNTAPTTTSDPSKTVSYSGKDGVDALTLLKETNKPETKTSEGLGEYVTSINGITPGANEYWGLYVNGKLSETGAAQTVTKSTDKIEWRLTNY